MICLVFVTLHLSHQCQRHGWLGVNYFHFNNPVRKIRSSCLRRTTASGRAVNATQSSSIPRSGVCLLAMEWPRTQPLYLRSGVLRTQKLRSWEPRADKIPPFKVWSRSEYRLAFFAHYLEYFHCPSFDLPGLFIFSFVQMIFYISVALACG